MANIQVNLKDKDRQNNLIPNTTSDCVADVAKGQALSRTLADTPDMTTLGHEPFSTLKDYAVGETVYKDNRLYTFTTAHPRGAWNAAHATQTSVSDLTGAVDARVRFIERSLGKYDGIGEVTLRRAKDGRYVNVSGSETQQSGYGISEPLSLNTGDMLLVPSAQAVPASVSVMARLVTRSYDKVIGYAYTYQAGNGELYDTATADHDASLVYTAVYDMTGETPRLTGWTRLGETYATLPATREVTEQFYEPLMRQTASAMPSTGYYVYLCPVGMTIVVSGLAATVSGGKALVVGWGIFKNIATNFIGAPGQSVIAQAMAAMQSEIDGLKAQLRDLGETRATCIDSADVPKVCGVPMVTVGSGAPAEVPQFGGQLYLDTAAPALYAAKAVGNSTGDWVRV